MTTVRFKIVLFLFFIFMAATLHVEAQGSFYMEVPKDGRIYVFNNMKVYNDWAQSGELGVSITRIGGGPNGETLVFDSEEAVHLYNFKHGLPGETFIKSEEKKPTMKVSWKDGKTTIETDLALLNLSNRVQVRYTQTEFTGSTTPGVDRGDSFGSFRIRRAKTKLDGWFYQTWLTYELQMNWPASPSPLEDANLNIDVTKGKSLLMIKGGQYKVPFGRQELTSSGSQQFVDRSIVSNRYATGRDQGVQVWGTPMQGKLDWRVGVFNGNGINQSTNDNSDLQFDARVTFQPWGDVKYSEGDFESTDKPLFAIAGQFETEEVTTPNTAVDPAPSNAAQRRNDTFGFDAVLKYKGLFVFFEDFERMVENKLTGAETDERGFNFQAGYFIVPKKFEVAGRFAQIDPNKDANNDTQKEYGVVFGYFYNKHNMKLQGDFRRLENEAASAPLDEINEFRLQLQFIF